MSARYLAWLWSNRFSVLLLAALTLAAGWFSLGALPESIFPDVSFPKVTVLVTDGRLPVKLMLLQVTKPLEQAAQGEPGVRVVRSQTGNGLSKLHVYFTASVDPQLAFLMLQARLAHVVLPTGALVSSQLMTPDVYPFAEYALVSDSVDSARMQPVFAFQVRPALTSVPGVYQVTGTGQGWPEIKVRLSERRLAEHDLQAGQVVAALRAAQGPFFSGVLDAFHQQFVVATTPRPADAAQLAALTLPLGPPGPGGARAPLALGDLGSVRLGNPPLLRDAALPGVRHALVIDVQAQEGANQVAVGRAVRAHIEALKSELPAGVRLVRVYDLSSLISSSLRDVWTALVLGSVIAWLVVLLFLRRLGAALATVLVVPLSIGAALLALHVLGYGLNVMTLGGLAAAVGALVDHAIVVMERGMHAAGSDQTVRRRSALVQAGHILLPMTLATLTSCLVFVPLIALSGTIGLLFRQMSIAIVVALIASQLVALLVTPVITIWLGGRSSTPPGRRGARLRHFYMRGLIGGMRRPWLAALAGALLAVLAIVCVMRLPTAFLPPWDEGVIAIPFRTPVGSNVAETTRVGRTLMTKALSDPAVARASLVVGRGFGNAHSTPNKGALTLVLKNSRAASTRTVMARLHIAFRALDPALIALGGSQVMVNRLGDLSGSHAPLEVFLFGSSATALNAAGGRLAAALRASHKFQSVVFKSPSAGPELDVTPKSQAGLYGLSPENISQTLRLRLWGDQAGFLLHGEQILPIRVSTGGRDPTLASVSNIPIRLSGKNYAPLTSVGQFTTRAAVPYVTHQNLVPDAYLWLQPAPGEGLSSAARHVRAIVAAQHLPKGMTSVLGGYYSQQKQSFRQMELILGGTLLILLILFGFQFGGQSMAGAAMVSIALSAPGGLLALVVTGTKLDSTAFLGLLLVFAIAVNNVILIFAPRAGGLGKRRGPAQVALSAGQRLRPILMTMLADIAGFLPLAIGVGRGTALLQPLAVAVMGGLTLAVFSSLWLAPVLYAGVYHWRRAT
ncbi:MAG TPA: efflux RND transporter permease subunit [Beijerinckiaceae bacterium]|nr:efflux RND transporter permease subunit [Beijerinckiaceae bacterium]